jgi:hypothetical protein
LLHDKRAEPTAAPEVLALQALAHVAGDPELGPRFLALSGLDAATLRANAGSPAVLAALIAFLGGREADLVATADAIGVKPEQLVRAGERLGG